MGKSSNTVWDNTDFSVVNEVNKINIPINMYGT